MMIIYEILYDLKICSNDEVKNVNKKAYKIFIHCTNVFPNRYVHQPYGAMFQQAY